MSDKTPIDQVFERFFLDATRLPPGGRRVLGVRLQPVILALFEAGKHEEYPTFMGSQSMRIGPVSVIYTTPFGKTNPRMYGAFYVIRVWWGPKLVLSMQWNNDDDLRVSVMDRREGWVELILDAYLEGVEAA